MTQAQQMIALALSALALMGVLIGHFRWWLPRWHKIKDHASGAVDVLWGRPEHVDPATGKKTPALPSLGQRLTVFDQDVEVLKSIVKPVAQDVAEVKKQVTENHHSNPEPTLPDRISDVRGDVAALGEHMRVSNRFMEAHVEWSQEWTSRVDRTLDEHAARLVRLEAVFGLSPSPQQD